MTRAFRGRVAIFLNFDGGGYGQEASEEGKEGGEEEEEESSRPKNGGEVGQENRPQGGGEEAVVEEGGRAQAPEESDAHGGPRGPGGGAGPGSVHCSDAGRQDGAEPRGGVAVPDRLAALMAPE